MDTRFDKSSEDLEEGRVRKEKANSFDSSTTGHPGINSGFRENCAELAVPDIVCDPLGLSEPSALGYNAVGLAEPTDDRGRIADLENLLIVKESKFCRYFAISQLDVRPNLN